MAKLNDVIYLSNEDYNTLITTGTVTISGTTLTYDANSLYITPEKLATTTEDGLMSAQDKSKVDNAVTLTGAQTIAGAKTFSVAPVLNNNVYLQGKKTDGTAFELLGMANIDTVQIGNASANILFRAGAQMAPWQDNKVSLGVTYSRFKNLYLAGDISDGTNSVTATNLILRHENQISTTYSALKSLRDSGTLVEGRWYRITDYACTTTTTNTSSAGHAFDIIVRADASNKLNENAFAALHSGDTYFVNNKLEAWQLKYSIDNIKWANTSTGKGVIYWMKDEFNNEAPYDFKNILFTKSGAYTNAYTFTYTNSGLKDDSLTGASYNNIIQYDNGLPFIVFYTTETTLAVNNNHFRQSSFITLGYGCGTNCFLGCTDIVLGADNGSNIFNNTSSAILGYENVGNYLYGGYSITFNDGCEANHIYYSNNITLGAYNMGNIFNAYCNNIQTGTNCYNNTFNCHCSYITLGSSTSALINYCQHIFIDSGCEYLHIISSDTSASSSNCLQNVHVHTGVSGTSSSYLTLTVPDRALNYETEFKKDGSTTILV